MANKFHSTLGNNCWEYDDRRHVLLYRVEPNMRPYEIDVLARIHRVRGSSQCPEAARRCSFESGMMVL